MKLAWKILIACILMQLALNANAQVTYSVTTIADDFLATGSPGNSAGTNLTTFNYGHAGAMAVASAANPKGEYQSILQFDLSGATNFFNTTYGTNLWSITGLSVTLTGNFSTNGAQPDNAIFPTVQGGNFVVEWLADNNWLEGSGTPRLPTTDGVSYSSLPTLLAGATSILCTNTFTPPGDNVPVIYPLPLDTNLVADVLTGSNATLLLYAADNQIAYLFNTHNFMNGNQPFINVTATALQPQILASYFTNGAFHLTGISAPNLPCQIQASVDLTTTNWQILATIPVDNTGAVRFDDTNAVNQSQRFYRLSR